MDPVNLKRRKIIGLILIGAILLVVVVILQAIPNDRQTTEEQQQATTDDPTSPESEQGQSTVTYDGFADLSQYGFTSYQMTGIRYALYQFNKTASNFTVTPTSIKQAPYDRDNPTDTVQVSFRVRVQDKSYDAQVDKYTDLKTIRLRLYEPGGQQAVYDSQPIDATTLSSNNSSFGDQ